MVKLKLVNGKNEFPKKWFFILAFLFLVSVTTIFLFEGSILSPWFNEKNFIWNSAIPVVPMSFPSLGACLSYVNATMYGAFWCPHCANQKEIFKDDFKNINYIECANQDYSQKEVCNDMKIKAYPTWIINGKKYEGELSLQRLSELTGCGNFQ